MELFSLLRREIKKPVRPLLIFITISGVANAFLISLVNMAAENASESEVNNNIFMLFVLGVIVVLISKKYVLDKAGVLIESAMSRLRNRIANKIRHTELNTLESIGNVKITTPTEIVTGNYGIYRAGPNEAQLVQSFL